MAYYLVTGGAGFIGSHIVEQLLEDGHRVRVLDNFSTGRKENLIYGPSIDTSLMEIVEGDLRDSNVVNKVAEGVEGVFHIGAVPSVIQSVEDPMYTTSVNILGTLNLLLAARDNGVGRVVFASSSSVYGDANGRPLSEKDVGSTQSPYALSKKTGEDYMRLFHQLYELKTVSVRYFNVFGPRQNPQGEYAAVIPRFITFALGGEPLTIFGDGLQTRDFTYVGNVVRGTISAMQAQLEGGEVFNVASGSPMTLLEMVSTLEDILHRKLEKTHLAPRPGDIRYSAADIDYSRDRLGYSPEISFAQGLRRTIETFLES